MNLEEDVMKIVNKHLKAFDTGEFFNGTLFIKSNKDTAMAIYIDLCNLYRKRNVLFAIGNRGEYSIDFRL